MENTLEMDVQHFQVITADYEALVSDLTNELRIVKGEQETLKKKVSTVVHENNRLTKELNELQCSKDPSLQSELVRNLQQQIHALTLEKEEIIKWWQHSKKSNEILENELKVFQSGNHEFVPKQELLKVKQNYEDKIKILHNDLDLTKKKLEENMKCASKELITKYQEIDQSLENQTSALKIVKNLEDEVLALQTRLQELDKTRIKLQKSLKQHEIEVQMLTKKNVEYREKVVEAVQVVEAALNEKDTALFRENEAKIQMQKISQNLNDTVKEMEEKITKELTSVRSEYNEKYELLLNKYNSAQEDIKVKTLEIEKFAAKCSLLENEIDKFRKGDFSYHEMNTSKLLILEKNLESTFQKLLISEKQNIQLLSEKETIKNDMEQMAGHYERTLKAKEIEKLSLQNKIKQLEASLDDKDLTLKRSSEQLTMGEGEKIAMQKDFRQQLENQEKLMAQVQADKIFELTSAYTERISQLQCQLDSKDKINKKWMNETKTIIEQLEKVVGDLKGEVRKLKKENIRLKEELQVYKTKFEQYKGFLHIISHDVNKISLKALDKDNPG